MSVGVDFDTLERNYDPKNACGAFPPSHRGSKHGYGEYY